MILSVPTDEHLATWIRTESDQRWPDRPVWAISYRYYKSNHPEGWCGIVRLLAEHGFADKSGHWRQLVHRLTGLRVPTSNEWLAYYRETGRGNRGPRGPYKKRPVVVDTEAMKPIENASVLRGEIEFDDRIGMTVKPRTCNVRKWDWRRQRWQTVGTETRMVVV